MLGADILRQDYDYYPWTTANGQGRLQFLKTGVPSNLTSLQSMAYTYDAVGNVTNIYDYKTASTAQIQHFTYDAFDRLKTASATGGSGGTYSTQTYQYDTIGNLLHNGSNPLTYPPSGATSVRPHAVTVLGSTTYSYDANGNQIYRNQLDLRAYYEFGAENRLERVVQEGTAALTCYTYDGDGQRVRQATYANLAYGRPATTASGVTLNQSQAATDGDLWADSGNGSSGEFAYTTQTGLRYIQIDLGAVYSVNTVRVWHYAADGRTYHNTKTQVSADGTTWTTVFDSATAGEYAETAQGKTHRFTARSVRYVRDYVNGSTANTGNHWVEIAVWGTTASSSTTYVGNTIEWTGNTSTMVKYYYAGGQRVAMRKGSTLYFLLGDHLGSTALTANSSGGKVAELRYKPWGESRYTSGATPTSFQYTGQRKDATGLYFYNARYYDPYLNRFLSPDTIVPDPANPQSLNRYSYVYNNPLKHIDVDGHFPWIIVGGLIGMGVAYGSQVVGNLNAGMDFGEALTTNIDPGKIATGGMIGMGAGILAPAAGTFFIGSGAVAATGEAALATGATLVTAEVMDGDDDEIKALEMIVGQGREWTTLGRYPGYVDTANRLQTNIFNIPAEEWAKLPDPWASNVKFLDEAIARGDVFLLDTPFTQGIFSEKVIEGVSQPTWYQMELWYLLEKGYQIVTVNGQDWLLPPN